MVSRRSLEFQNELDSITRKIPSWSETLSVDSRQDVGSPYVLKAYENPRSDYAPNYPRPVKMRKDIIATGNRYTDAKTGIVY